MNVLVIGGTGHTGGFLVRDLIAQGHDVVCLSRGQTPPYLDGPSWDKVRQVHADRAELESNGRLADLLGDERPDAVVDIVCFRPESARLLFEALAGKIKLLVQVGTAWVYGDPEVIPTPESYRGVPLNDYARAKLDIQDYYLERHEKDGFPVSVVHPTQITGAGKKLITPEGTNDVAYLERMQAGEEVPLPAHGKPFVHHVHPSDVAQVIRRALERPDVAAGQVYNAGSPYAMSYRGYFNFLRSQYGWTAKARSVSLAEYQDQYGPNDTVKQHMIQPVCVDIRKAAEQLGYAPAFTARQAVVDAIGALGLG